MGKVYKRKRRSCGLCKPHKLGMAPKATDKQRALAALAREMIKEFK